MISVSVIIPVFNAEKYLSQCLDSIVNQTLTNIEIICVDDGSTDTSFQILKEYEEKDSRVIVLSKSNAGAGTARNEGLKIAKGKYLSFLDADDFFERNMLECAYGKAEQDNADICIFESDLYDVVTKNGTYCDWSFKREFFQNLCRLRLMRGKYGKIYFECLLDGPGISCLGESLLKIMK